MKALKILVFLSLISVLCVAQTVTSSCSITDTIAPKYKKDAERLAIRRAFHTNSSWKDSVSYNRVWSKEYLKALIAVHNATTLPARDTVIRIIKIHTLADPNIKTFFIDADSNLLWMKNIRNNIVPTGNTYLDNAIARHYFQKTQFNAWSNVPYHDAVFKSDTTFNVWPLANKLFTFPGVVASGPDAIAIDGNDIFDSLNVNFTILTYTYGWVDCYAGCINRRYWHFKVYGDCSVEYTGSDGDPVPLNVGILIQTKDFTDVKIYPNPTKDKLHFKSEKTQFKKLNIFDSFGQVVYESNNVISDQEINISFLSAGVYYLKTQNEEGQKVFKIIKE